MSRSVGAGPVVKRYKHFCFQTNIGIIATTWFQPAVPTETGGFPETTIIICSWLSSRQSLRQHRRYGPSVREVWAWHGQDSRKVLGICSSPARQNHKSYTAGKNIRDVVVGSHQTPSGTKFSPTLSQRTPLDQHLSRCWWSGTRAGSEWRQEKYGWHGNLYPSPVTFIGRCVTPVW